MFSRASPASSGGKYGGRSPAWSSSCGVIGVTASCPCLKSPQDDDVSFRAVLIFSSDPLAAALLGAAVELAGHAPHFAGTDEPARAALMRVRPRLALIDCDHEESCSDEFVGPALMTGARVLLFRSRGNLRDMAELADRLKLRVIDMPTSHDTLTAVLGEMLDD